MLQALYILVAVLILGVIVTVHEFGHYVAGRLCGIGVVEFAVGFGPKIIGWKRKGIQYSVRAIPLGGYCKFVGEDEENAAPDAMNRQPVWKRFITILSGPLMNFLLAFVVGVILLAFFSVAEIFPIVSGLQENMPAQAAGLQAGDVVTSINGAEVSYDDAGVEEIRTIIGGSDLTQPIVLGIDRGGEALELSIVPEAVETQVVDPETGEETTQIAHQIGVVFGSRTYTVGEAILYAPKYMVNVTGSMLGVLRNLVFKGEGLKEISGPVGIISYVSTQVNEGWGMILNIVFFISLNLGIMNLLPLPALDGGRLVFLAVEAVRRKPVPPEKEGMVHGIGLLLLFGLIIFVTYQDIVRIITG